MREIPDLEKIRKRHKDLLPEPMFDMQPASQGEKPKQRSKRVVDTRICPICKAKVGTVWNRVQAKQVLVFRDHDRVTYSGHRFRCTSSGADASDAKKAIT